MHRIRWSIVFKRRVFIILLCVFHSNESDVFEYSKAETPFPNHFTKEKEKCDSLNVGILVQRFMDKMTSKGLASTKILIL